MIKRTGKYRLAFMVPLIAASVGPVLAAPAATALPPSQAQAAPQASASDCYEKWDKYGVTGTWRSNDGRLSRIDVWIDTGASAGCAFYIKAWETCEYDAKKDCTMWKERLWRDGDVQYAKHSWSNATETLYLYPQGRGTTSMKVKDVATFTDGHQNNFDVTMARD